MLYRPERVVLEFKGHGGVVNAEQTPPVRHFDFNLEFLADFRHDVHLVVFDANCEFVLLNGPVEGALVHVQSGLIMYDYASICTTRHHIAIY